jgi:hypothetical protein
MKVPAFRLGPALFCLRIRLSRLQGRLVRRSFAEGDALTALRIELRGSHQVHIVERTRFACAAWENVVEAVAGQPILGDCPDGFIAQSDQRKR